MNTAPDLELDRRLRESLGAAPRADFAGWQARHGDAVACLNPVLTARHRRRRKVFARFAGAALAACMLVAFASVLFSQRESFAQVAQAIERAKTITWTTTFYERITSQDGKRTWLKEESMDRAYRSPHFYRDTRYDDAGQVRSVEIVDASSNSALRLDMKKKQAIWLAEPTNQYGTDGPFESVRHILKDLPIELVGQKQLDGMTVNVFRYQRPNSPTINPVNSFDHRKSVDIWLNAKTKELVRVCDPGADCFDPETAPDRDNPAEESFSKGRLMGSMKGDIVLDAELDPELFSLIPPEGFEVVVEPPRPTVSEAEMIEWLGAAAHFNDGLFFENFRGFDLDRYNREVATKKEADRTEFEQALYELVYKHLLNRNSPVIPSFANEYTVGGRFRYLGDGVKLGDADRIVLFYKLKSTGQYRAVYGDLTVKDVTPQELPLPVEE